MGMPWTKTNGAMPSKERKADVSNGFDLTLLPIYRLSGQDLPTLPGLLALDPPKRTARGRDRDRLVVYLSLTGKATFTTAEALQLTTRAAEQFYNSPGSLTSAMRSAAENINHALLERNLRTTGSGEYSVGLLAMAALRGTQLTLLLCGPAHAFLIASELRHVHDPALSGRGLGLSQTLTVHYSQAELAPDSRVLLCGHLPPAWENSISKDHAPASLEATRRRLVALEPGDVNAVLLQLREGPGRINVLRPGQETEAEAPAKPVSSSPDQTPPAAHPDLPPAESEAQPAGSYPPQPEPSTQTAPPSAYSIPAQPELQVPPPAQGDETSASRDFPASIPRLKPGSQPVEDEAPVISEIGTAPVSARRPGTGTRKAARAAVGGMQTWRRMTGRLSQGFRNLLPRLLPGSDADKPVSIPTSIMVIMAIAVPLVVVTVASLVYFRIGRGTNYDAYYSQAEATAEKAVGQTDPVYLREVWRTTLYYLDQAEENKVTPQSSALRQQAQSSLDGLLGIVRLDFQAAINGGMPGGVQVTRMTANDADLYMLDAAKGSILRAFLTGVGYQLDNTFQCAPGAYGGYNVSQLVDLVALPRPNSLDATVMAVDTSGNLLYCAPDKTPQAVPLAPPDTNWGRVTAIALDGNNLFVMDGTKNAVWIYGGENSSFSDLPVFYFSEQIPNLTDAVDMAINGDDLYVLHSDGHLSTCTRSRIDTVPTRCTDPAIPNDPHPASLGNDPFTETHFIQMTFTAPPDSAILLLDSESRAVYRLSPRSLELLNQLRPYPQQTGRLGPAVGMAVSPNHMLFLALGNEVYYATDVP